MKINSLLLASCAPVKQARTALYQSLKQFFSIFKQREKLESAEYVAEAKDEDVKITIK